MNGLLLALLLLFQVPAALQLRTGVVTGIVRTDKGVPLEGVRVVVMPAGGGVADGVFESIGQTDKDGRYRLESISPGNYHVVFGRDAAMTYHPGVAGPEGATTIAVTAGSAISVPDLVLTRRRVTGRVVDAATGQSRRIAHVFACCAYMFAETGPGGGTASRSMARTASVNDDGTFVFNDLPPGTFAIQVMDSSIITVGQPLVVGDADVTDVVVKVSSGVSVEGEVVDRLGVPVTGVTARLRSKTDHTASGLAAASPGSVGGGSTVSFPLGNNTVRSISLASLNIIAVDGRASDPVVPAVPQPLQVGPNGRFTMSRVLPAIYTLEINAPGGNPVEREIEVGLSGLRNIRVEMPFTQIAGRLVAADNSVLTKVTSVRLISTSGDSRISYGFPDDAGRFVVLLAPGEYRVSTDGQGHSVRSISTPQFVFDGVNKPDIVITVE